MEEEREGEVLTSIDSPASSTAATRELEQLLELAAVHVFLEYIFSREEEERRGRGKTWEREEEAEGTKGEVVQEGRGKQAEERVEEKKLVIFSFSLLLLSSLALSFAFFSFLVL